MPYGKRLTDEQIKRYNRSSQAESYINRIRYYDYLMGANLDTAFCGLDHTREEQYYGDAAKLFAVLWVRKHAEDGYESL